MSQSSQSDAFVDLAARLSYKADRKAIVSRLEYLPSIQDADAAREWVMEAGAAVVRSPLFVCPMPSRIVLSCLRWGPRFRATLSYRLLVKKPIKL